MSLSKISGWSPKAGFYSPKAEDMSIPAADLPMLRVAFQRNDVNCLENAGLNVIMEAKKNRLVIRRCVEGSSDNFDWRVPLAFFRNSGVLAWPVEKMQIPSYTDELVTFRRCGAPVVLPILSWANIEATTFEWVSWCQQSSKYPLAMDMLAPATRAIVTESPAPLLAIAAKRVFFSLGVADLQSLADSLHIVVAKSDNLYATLLTLVQSGLGCDAITAHEHIAQRLPGMFAHCDFDEEVLDIDEAADLFAQQDVKLVREMKVQARAHQRSLDDFTEKFIKGKESAMKLAAPKGRGRGRGRGRGAVAAAPKIKMPKDIGVLPQSDLKAICPPGSYIWQSRGLAWHTKVPPFGESSRSWAKWGGTHGAACAAIREAWRRFLVHKGKPVSECPVDGLFA